MAAPRGLGYNVEQEAKRRQAPLGGEVLGVLNDTFTAPGPQGTETAWQGPDGQVSMSEPPPPWELDENSEISMSDARRFVEVPRNWTLHWINPRLLDQFGWRDWAPVMATDPQVKVKVDTMVSPEGNIRRGGNAGDILAWMYTSWVVSRRRHLQKQTDRQTAASVTKQQELQEEFKSGKYGPFVQLEGAKHPTHTMVEGRSIRD